ncbi:tRNA (adenosine(37)-N6)-threonylcarbamoyltransferase complex ATPase subunit type 1 TsaE [Ferruginibacter paludis]|uniref:tRNA (adenosine(37)-N6)-threonylcarbamoyltransferase complex ATPase subunit type 1 TsaE n=1 Tax=Ferruginibacter paludis TaxID=1310417 RepID=UPI0025B2B119|nr:tRNA (adenosine(37)-N6)-threonylcarbamoyltransferase complex ATPase subunit type 1 TsaE [Ferruginibacter paludis]MDN3657652.1 tRNA (adenosine(37)-N6)-threonylcarbamoyltransferase complex ATPase subunit type 1 TsaE [Ferruginibacter paludis]
MELIYTLDNIEAAAREFTSITNAFKVFAFEGEMGAGKTTFVHALCEVAGVTDGISSPTFSIINQYITPQRQLIYHIDLYRLKNEEEAIQAGVEDCLYSGNTCFVEWPQKTPGLFPDGTLHVAITAIDTNTRKLKINL